MRGLCTLSLLYYYYTAFPNYQPFHISALLALSSVVLALYLILAKKKLYCFQAIAQYHLVLSSHGLGKCVKVQNKHNSFSWLPLNKRSSRLTFNSLEKYAIQPFSFPSRYLKLSGLDGIIGSSLWTCSGLIIRIAGLCKNLKKRKEHLPFFILMINSWLPFNLRALHADWPMKSVGY